jgi:hypothetical protein
MLQAVARQALAHRALGTDDLVVKARIADLLYKGPISESHTACIAWFLVVLRFPFIAGSFAAFVNGNRRRSVVQVPPSYTGAT